MTRQRRRHRWRNRDGRWRRRLNRWPPGRGPSWSATGRRWFGDRIEVTSKQIPIQVKKKRRHQGNARQGSRYGTRRCARLRRRCRRFWNRWSGNDRPRRARWPSPASGALSSPPTSRATSWRSGSWSRLRASKDEGETGGRNGNTWKSVGNTGTSLRISSVRLWIDLEKHADVGWHRSRWWRGRPRRARCAAGVDRPPEHIDEVAIARRRRRTRDEPVRRERRRPRRNVPIVVRRACHYFRFLRIFAM